MAAKRKSPAKRPAIAKKAFVLRISLLEIEPEIWRRVAVPADITLARLHDVIQQAMQWVDCHMHVFRFRSRKDPMRKDETKDERRTKLHQLAKVGDEFAYEYDFGDGWTHLVVVEAETERKQHPHLPICLDGARRGPPEDVGGPWGYADFLEAYLDPKDERHEDMVEWIGPRFDPERFDPVAINANLRRLAAGRAPYLPEDDARWDEPADGESSLQA